MPACVVPSAVVRIRATYLLATLALLVTFPCAVGVLTPTPSAIETWAVLAASGGFAAILLLGEARRDSYAFAQFAVVALLFPGTFAVAAYAVAESATGRMRAIMTCATCALGIVGAVVQLWREHHIEDVGVNVLLERFGMASIFETDGVQWAVERGPENVEAGGSWISVFLQSCVGASRSVTIQLEDVTGLLQRRGSVTTPRLEPVTLGPGEVGALQVPVCWGPKPAKKTWLYVSLRARGEPGRRLRRFRGRPASERTRQWFQLFALLGGYVVWGGGVRFAFVNPSERSGSDEAPPPTWHSMVRAIGST